MKRSSKYFLGALLVLAFGVGLWLFAEEYEFVFLKSGSMAPAYPTGSVCLVQLNGDYQTGTIITFVDDDGSYVTHRLIGDEEGNLQTQGDANDSPDHHRDPLGAEDVVGPVIYAWTPTQLAVGSLSAVIGIACSVAVFWLCRQNKT